MKGCDKELGQVLSGPWGLARLRAEDWGLLSLGISPFQVTHRAFSLGFICGQSQMGAEDQPFDLATEM